MLKIQSPPKVGTNTAPIVSMLESARFAANQRLANSFLLDRPQHFQRKTFIDSKYGFPLQKGFTSKSSFALASQTNLFRIITSAPLIPH